jgi:hypothetical protein
MLVFFYILLRIEMGSEQRMRRTVFLMTNALWGVQGLCISTADLVSYPHVLEITSGGSLGLGFQLKGCSPQAVNKISLVVTRQEQEVLGGVECHLPPSTYDIYDMASTIPFMQYFLVHLLFREQQIIIHFTCHVSITIKQKLLHSLNMLLCGTG